MKSMLKKLIEKIAPSAFLAPEGGKGIEKQGHRGYVGGMWDEIGQLQFDFLVSKGLKPDSFFIGYCVRLITSGCEGDTLPSACTLFGN